MARRSWLTVAILSPETFALALLVFIGATWVKRVLWMASFSRSQAPLVPREAPSGPLVSVIVPAKDEEKNLPNCLNSLFAQTYGRLEYVVVDDRSSDATPEIVARYSKQSKHPFRGIRVEKLPSGWTGKNHAMVVGSKAAAGEWLLFTDADTTHAPQSVSTAIAEAEARRLDFLTLAPETECRSFWENTVQPLAVSGLALWFDPRKVNDPKSGVTLANGQFILVKRSAYEAVGGNESVRTETVEDVALAKRFRAAGFQAAFLNGTKLYSTRMYSTLAEIHRGWTRIFTHLFEKKFLPILHKIFLYLFFSIYPFAVFVIESAWRAAGSAAYSPVLWKASGAVCAFIVVVRAIGNRMVRSNPVFAVLHPLGSAVMVWILGSCLVRIALGRPSLWRGDSHPS